MPRPTWATRRSVLAVGTGCASRRWVVTRNVCVNEASKGKLATKKCLAPSLIVRAMAFAFEANVCAWLDLKGTIVQNNSRATWMATTPTLNVQGTLARCWVFMWMGSRLMVCRCFFRRLTILFSLSCPVLSFPPFLSSFPFPFSLWTVMVHATLANVIAMLDGNPTRVNAIKN